MKNLMLSWVFWALLSAAFAALTAIFAKIGIENVNSDFTTFIRTVVILLFAGLIVFASGNWQQPSSVSAKKLVVPRSVRCRDWRVLDLLLPRFETRRCRARCSDRQAQRRLRGGFCRALPGRAACVAELAGRDPDRLRGRSRRLPRIGETAWRRRCPIRLQAQSRVRHARLIRKMLRKTSRRDELPQVSWIRSGTYDDTAFMDVTGLIAACGSFQQAADLSQ
jgi:EamA-like transporter family